MKTPPEVNLYLDKAQKALIQARDVFELKHYDLTISRAYYAMFYAACALLSSQEIFTKRHSAVHATFAQYLVKPGLIEPQYSRMLGSTFNLRLDSDYDIGISHNQEEAADTIRDAEQFVKRTERYLHDEGILSL